MSRLPRDLYPQVRTNVAHLREMDARILRLNRLRFTEPSLADDLNQLLRRPSCRGTVMVASVLRRLVNSRYGRNSNFRPANDLYYLARHVWRVRGLRSPATNPYNRRTTATRTRAAPRRPGARGRVARR